MTGHQVASAPAELDETFTGLLQRPYQQHPAKAAEIADHAELVAAMSPQVLVARIHQGTTLAREQCKKDCIGGPRIDASLLITTDDWGV